MCLCQSGFLGTIIMEYCISYLFPVVMKVPLVSEDVVQFCSVQSLSHVRLFVTPWITARQASLSITNSRSSPRLTSIESVMPSSHFILCCLLFLLSPIPPSIRVFSKESTLRMRWPKYWSFSFSIIPSRDIPGLISFRMDWLDLLCWQSRRCSNHCFYSMHYMPCRNYLIHELIEYSHDLPWSLLCFSYFIYSTYLMLNGFSQISNAVSCSFPFCHH